MRDETADYFVLDNTLRYMYIALRNKRASLLAIEFIHRGKKWRADTAEEAIRLRQALEIEDRREQLASDPLEEKGFLDELDSPWTPAVFWTFLDGIGEQQKDAVLAMAEHDGISSADLTNRLHLINEMSLAGVISGLSKQLKTLGLTPPDLYTVNTSWNGKKKERFFFLQKHFRQTAEEVGWPKEKGEQHDARSATTKHKRK
jgi:hypothetical protein